MTQLEHKITDSFTIDHAKQTLQEICENIDREVNLTKDFEEIRKLEGMHRYLSNAINQINEAKDYLK